MKLFLVTIMFIAANAYAKSEAEVKVDATKFKSPNPKIETSFQADNESKNAWIVLAMTDGPAEGGNAAGDAIPPEQVKVKLEGLVLDSDTGNIVYEQDQEKTVCATPKKRAIAGRTLYKNSKNCKIHVSMAARKTDKGFATEKEHIVNVVLDTATK